MPESKCIAIRTEEIGALDEVLTEAAADVWDYLKEGNPKSDYGDEWPEVATEKSVRFWSVACLLYRLDLPLTGQVFIDLSNAFLASGKEYAIEEAQS